VRERIITRITADPRAAYANDRAARKRPYKSRKHERHRKRNARIVWSPLDLTYKQTHEDVRNQSEPSFDFLMLKEARNIIPEFDGNARNRVREFLNATNYTMKNIHPADEQTLLNVILCTKFKGKAMVDFHTRDIHSYEQLTRELEVEYLSGQSTAYLQLEFNSLK